MRTSSTPSIYISLAMHLLDERLACLHMRPPEDRAQWTHDPSLTTVATNDTAAEDQHITFPALCMGCRHEWQAVAPVGTDTATLSCPRCWASKGMSKQFVFFQNAPVWHCTCCESILFSCINRDGAATAVCASCGNMAPLIEMFDSV